MLTHLPRNIMLNQKKKLTSYFLESVSRKNIIFLIQPGFITAQMTRTE